MARTLSLSSLNSTNVRFLADLGLRRIGLRASAALTPELAGVWAERLFLTPPVARRPFAAVFAADGVRTGSVPYRGRRVVTWTWGDAAAPAVVLAHGWGGHAAQMASFVEPLLAAGFRVVAFDQPAHGLSEGRLTGLPDFAGATAAVAKAAGDVQALVAHSLGATGAALAHAARLGVKRVVLVSPPSDLVGYSRRFARWHWMPESVRRTMQAAIEERYGLRWSELEIDRVAPCLTADALVIHDRRDRMVPFKQGARFARTWRGARLLATEGLGHNRILQDRGVVDAAVDFMRGGSGGAPVAETALPHPAPLY